MPMRGAVHAGGAGVERGKRVDDRQIAVAVAVPVDADAAAAVVDDLRDEADDGGRARGRRVADGVGDADAARAGADRRRIQLPQRLGVGACRVLGDIHHRQAFAARRS